MQFGAFTAYWFGQTKKVEFGETKAPQVYQARLENMSANGGRAC